MHSKKNLKDHQRALGRWLANLRVEKGLSQEALSIQLGKGQSDIAKIEGGHKKITLFELIYWLDALDVPFSKIVDVLDPIVKSLPKRKSLWDD